ncbi:MAG: DUF4160 domain-containing protein [Armatimonadetes bacterium]|nr:DUF4160 domain-containing protein [Armatimonadota bacterium]
MPTVLRLDGYRFFFFSNEGAEAPHIHVENAENYAKFWLKPVILATSSNFSARELRQVRELIEANHDLLEAKWHEFFGC